METWTSDSDRNHIPDLHPGHLLSLSLTLPSPKKSNTALEEPKEEDKEQGQGEEQGTGRQTSLFRLHHAEVKNCPNPPHVSLGGFFRNQCSNFLPGNATCINLNIWINNGSFFRPVRPTLKGSGADLSSCSTRTWAQLGPWAASFSGQSS